ncbi:MAG: nucleotidyltransferase substrate binding protein [Oligoflexia bacterium]|nr:nucleotidyltransferase substrate binding protein [Oligoflexia bacterium]
MTTEIILLKNFEQALAKLKDGVDKNLKSDIEKSGLIKYFEFCFELSWKAIQKIARTKGISDEIASPKSAFRIAFSQGWIQDEVKWISMLNDRNIMSHTYNFLDAEKVFLKIPDYSLEMEKLLIKLKM